MTIVTPQTLSLLCHPDTPATGAGAVGVQLEQAQTGLTLRYQIHGVPALRWPAPDEGERQDGLWQTTCLEMFVRADGETAYREFNFAPTGDWQAYAFESYRTGISAPPMEPPTIRQNGLGDLSVSLPREALPPAARLHIALSAVIEETDGTKSYWALAHPPGKPDFHHPDCFALTLWAGEGA